MTGRRGRKWGQLRGEYLEVRELAGVLRDVVSAHGLTLRDLEARMPYGRTVIAENLNGEKRPAWEFVAAFLDACAGRDRQARALLESKVKLLWDAAAPGRVTRLAPSTPGASTELVPTGLHAWVTTLRETALAQQTVASLQLSVSRHLGLVNGLTAMLNQLTIAAQTLTDERDALREELRAHIGTADELHQTRMLLEETQRRLDAAEQFQAETSRRMDEALRQREEAEHLKQAALMQAEAARRRLADLEQHAVSFMDHPSGEQEPISPDRSLMGAVDQVVAAEILRRVDDTLEEEAENLDRLQSEVSAASADIAPMSAGQSAGRPAISADNQLERYRSLVQSGAQVVWVAAPDGSMKEDSPEWRLITGQAAEEFLGYGWLDSVHHEDRERVERDWRECVRTGKVFNDRYRIRTKGGSYRHYDVRAAPVERDGKIVEWVGASTDVTSQREAEEMRGRLTEQLSAATLRTARLQQATSMLAEALTVEQVVEVITEVGRTAISALRSAVALLDSDSTRLRVINPAGLPSGQDVPGGVLRLDSPDVMTRAIVTRRPVLVQDLEDLRTQFKGELDIDPASLGAISDERSWVGLPLLAAGAPLGALRFSFARPRRITEEERVCLEALAGQCALAVERAGLYEREHKTSETLQRSLLPDKLPSIPGLAKRRRRKKNALAAGLAVAFAGAGTVIGLHFSGSAWPPVPPPCAGCVTDGSRIFVPGSQDMRTVEAAIRKENIAVRAGGRRYVTIALLIPLTSSSTTDAFVSRMVDQLRGAYLAQVAMNSQDIVGVQLLLANEGTSAEETAGRAVARLKLMEASARLVAVVGLGVSVENTETAAQTLVADQMPMFGTLMTADEFNGVRYPGLDQMVPDVSAQIDALAAALPAPRRAVLVYDQRADDIYTDNLKAGFIRTFGKNLTDQPQPYTPGESVTNLEAEAIASEVCYTSGPPPVVFYDGGVSVLASLISRFQGASNCRGKKITMVTAAGGDGLPPASTKSSAGGGQVSVIYSDDFNMGKITADFRASYARQLAAIDPAANGLADTWTIGTYNAMQAAWTAIQAAYQATNPAVPTKTDLLGLSVRLHGEFSPTGATGPFEIAADGRLLHPDIPIYVDSGGKRITLKPLCRIGVPTFAEYDITDRPPCITPERVRHQSSAERPGHEAAPLISAASVRPGDLMESADRREC